MTAKSKHKAAHLHKRTGNHQKRTRRFHSTYWPYLPMVIMIFVSIVISGMPVRKHGTLAFATEMSPGNLLASSNTERGNNGVGALQLNTLLSSAAQAKANDMVARNYWSHTTPDGQEPWVFINNAGYQYQKAGENLAYGFLTSSDTVTGWMNSATHRANMLDSDYTDVGFGYANGNNFNNSGEETIVVAMYGKPLTVAAAPSPAPATTMPVPTPAPSQTVQSNTQQSPATQTQANSAGSQTPASTPAQNTSDNNATPSIATSNPQVPSNTTKNGRLLAYESPQKISQIQILGGSNSSWSMTGITLILCAAVGLLLLKHAFALKRLLRDSEHFVLHHPLFDSTIIGVIILGLTLARTVGSIL